MGARMRGRLLAVGVMFALGVVFAPAAAHGDHVTCGDVITTDTTLDADLDCGDLSGGGQPALTIGADEVTLDLNGHTISTRCETGCEGTSVLDVRGGHDRLHILGGTIRSGGVHTAVALSGVEGSTLEDLTISTGFVYLEPAVGISLTDSHRNRLESITIGGGDPSLLLSASDRNRIARSTLNPGIAIHEGDGVHLLDGSDHNRIVEGVVDGQSSGIWIKDSVGTRVRRSYVRGYLAAIAGFGASQSVISRSTLGDTFHGSAVSLIASDENLIRRNEVRDGNLDISGDRNQLQGNDVSAGLGGGIFVLQGDANQVRNNDVIGFLVADGIAVGSAATNTLVQGNFVNGAWNGNGDIDLEDGIDVDAPGTVIRANRATNNGDLGIEAVPGVIDGGGNRASGNGNPLQCVNVRCHVRATDPAGNTGKPAKDRFKVVD